MKGFVFDERKPRQKSMRSLVMEMSVSSTKQEDWKEGNWRESLGVLGDGITRKLVARRLIRLWLVKVGQ